MKQYRIENENIFKKSANNLNILVYIIVNNLLSIQNPLKKPKIQKIKMQNSKRMHAFTKSKNVNINFMCTKYLYKTIITMYGIDLKVENPNI